MKVTGGTHTRFVDPAAFAMPAGLAVRYDQPSAALAPFVSAYNLYWSASRERRVDWFLPAGPMLCFTVDAGPIEVGIGHRSFAAPAGGFLLGATGRAYRGVTHGGGLIGIGLTAAGWARLTDRPAREFFNRIDSLDSVLAPAQIAAFRVAIDAAPNDAALKPVFDVMVADLLLDRSLPDDDALITAMTSVMLVDGVTEVADVAERLALDPVTLRRLAVRYFGMTPKLLLRRARFLRSLLTYVDDDQDRNRIDTSYHDVSHFLRDANAFLGATPQRFLQFEGDFLRASIRARSAVCGAPVQALHDASPLLAAGAV